MAALSAAAAVTIAGCGNDKAAATPDEGGQAMTEGALLDRSLDRTMDREGETPPAQRQQQAAPRAVGPLFHPPEWSGADPIALQAAAIYFYQNPTAIDDPLNELAIIGLYNCAGTEAVMGNEVRRAMLLSEYRPRLRAWLANAPKQATFELTARLGDYDQAAGRFRWESSRQPAMNLGQFAVGSTCMSPSLYNPIAMILPPISIQSPSFTLAEADAYITRNPYGRQVTLRLHATVPNQSVIVRGTRHIAITPVNVEVIRP